MANKVNYTYNKFYKSISYTARPRKLNKVRQNPEKCGCGSFR